MLEWNHPRRGCNLNTHACQLKWKRSQTKLDPTYNRESSQPGSHSLFELCCSAFSRNVLAVIFRPVTVNIESRVCQHRRSIGPNKSPSPKILRRPGLCPSGPARSNTQREKVRLPRGPWARSLDPEIRVKAQSLTLGEFTRHVYMYTRA